MLPKNESLFFFRLAKAPALPRRGHSPSKGEKGIFFELGFGYNREGNLQMDFHPSCKEETMKRFGLTVGLVLSLAFLLTLPAGALAPQAKVAASLKASVTQRLGADVDITIAYGRPGVKGRKIWGELVPFGLAPGNKYSKEKPFPWRAGANENTTIEFNKDLLIEGNPLPAGKYGIHMIPSEKDWVIIFSKNNSAWGSFSYNQEEDALRVTVTPVKAPHQEWLTFGFEDLEGVSATAYLHWEQLKVPFKIKLAQ